MITLLHGWLLPELKDNYDGESYNLSSLKTNINLWVAYLCQRKIDNPSNLDELVDMSTNCFMILSQVDEELQTLEENDFKLLLNGLANDVVFYDYFINRVYGKVKTRLEAGNTDDLIPLVTESDDYKQWQKELGIETIGIRLIDNWKHPLSETLEVSGEDCVNGWGFASVICGVATGRFNQGDPEKATAFLISQGILKPEIFKSHLEVCKYIDAEYIKLINDCVSRFDDMVDEATK